MNYQVVILSEDAVFARMLELEFEACHLKILATSALEAGDFAEILILDLDSVESPPSEQYRTLIGFSRRPATAAEDARSCSMILRRPFRVSLLRREVLAQTGMGVPTSEMGYEPHERSLKLDSKTRTLHCDRQKIAMSPQEFRILQCLLEHRGRAVSRAKLSELIGTAAGNKTDVYICYLRRKTDKLPGGRLIRTVRGEGYMIK
jgi:hypothetical protein